MSDQPRRPATYVRPTRYEVSVIPQRFLENDNGSDAWTLSVVYRRNSMWSVTQGDGPMDSYCMAADGTWHWQPDTAQDQALWRALHWFSLEDALGLARRYCPDVMVYGKTALEILEAELAEERGDGS